jgi:hypothetical protein
MLKTLVSLFNSLIFFGLAQLLFQNWAVAILCAVFTCLFTIFMISILSVGNRNLIDNSEGPEFVPGDKSYVNLSKLTGEHIRR